MKTIRPHLTVFMVLTVLAGIGFFLVTAATIDNAMTHTPSLHVKEGVVLPAMSAKAAFVMDVETGTVLYEQAPDEVLPIASVTKLFSAAVFWSQTDPLGTTTVLFEDVATDGRSGRLVAGQTYQNRELLFPLLLESSNDAAATIARSASFDVVAAMNDFAAASGAPQTTFFDTSGLSDRNVSTARELATLFVTINETSPHIVDITTLSQYLNHVNAWKNNSPFIDEPGYAGGKHGFTEAAGRTALVQFTESISGTDRGVVYVVLGSEDLTSDITPLRKYVQAVVQYE